MSEEDLNTYKKYVSDLDITNYIVLDNESNYWYSTEYVDKMFKKQDLEIERLNNIIKEIRKQLDYLETYSSKEDVFEDMKRRLDRIDKIIGSDKE